MNVSALQVALVAAITQIVAAVVGFGILSSTEAGLVINATVAVVNVLAVLASGLHGIKLTLERKAQA